MELAILLFVSITPAIFTWWRVTGWYAWTMAFENKDHRDCGSKHKYPSLYSSTRECHCKNWKPSFDIWVGGFFIGLLAGIIWPILLVLFLGNSITGNKGITYKPKAVH